MPTPRLLQEGLVPQDGHPSGLLHSLGLGNQALQGALHGLPSGSLQLHEAGALHDLQLDLASLAWVPWVPAGAAGIRYWPARCGGSE